MTGDPTRGTGGSLPDKETDRRQRSSRGLQCGRYNRVRRAEVCLALIRLREGVTNCHIRMNPLEETVIRGGSAKSVDGGFLSERLPACQSARLGVRHLGGCTTWWCLRQEN